MQEEVEEVEEVEVVPVRVEGVEGARPKDEEEVVVVGDDDVPLGVEGEGEVRSSRLRTA